MALELGCSTRIKAPQGMNLGELKNVKQLAPAVALWLKSHGHKPGSLLMHLGNNQAPLLPKTILVKVTKNQIAKPGMCGAAQAPSNEGSRYECYCVSIAVRVMRCPSSLFDAWLLQHRVPGTGDRKGSWGRVLRLRVLACALTGYLSRWILTSSR